MNLKTIAGIVVAFVTANSLITSFPVNAYSHSSTYYTDFSCGSEKITDKAELNIEFNSGELVVSVYIPDMICDLPPCDYCFGSMQINEDNSDYTVQYSDLEVNLCDNGRTYEVWCVNDARDTALHSGYLFSVWFDHWAVGDYFLFNGYCYTLTPELVIERTVDITGTTSVDNFYYPEPTFVEPTTMYIAPNTESVVIPATELSLIEYVYIETEEPTIEPTEIETVAETELPTLSPSVLDIQPTTNRLYDAIEKSTQYTKQVTRIEFQSEFRVLNPGPYWLEGDVNIDGFVDMLDVVYLIRFMTDDGVLPLAGIANADYNESGEPDFNDIMTLMYRVNGLTI